MIRREFVLPLERLGILERRIGPHNLRFWIQQGGCSSREQLGFYAHSCVQHAKRLTLLHSHNSKAAANKQHIGREHYLPGTRISCLGCGSVGPLSHAHAWLASACPKQPSEGDLSLLQSSILSQTGWLRTLAQQLRRM